MNNKMKQMTHDKIIDKLKYFFHLKSDTNSTHIIFNHKTALIVCTYTEYFIASTLLNPLMNNGYLPIAYLQTCCARSRKKTDSAH